MNYEIALRVCFEIGDPRLVRVFFEKAKDQVLEILVSESVLFELLTKNESEND